MQLKIDLPNFDNFLWTFFLAGRLPLPGDPSPLLLLPLARLAVAISIETLLSITALPFVDCPSFARAPSTFVSVDAIVDQRELLIMICAYFVTTNQA